MRGLKHMNSKERIEIWIKIFSSLCIYAAQPGTAMPQKTEQEDDIDILSRRASNIINSLEQIYPEAK